MTNGVPVDRAEPGGNEPKPARHGSGRWLLTWAGVFSVVIVLAVVFVLTIIVYAT